MSDTTPHDAAILVLREREHELDGEIQAHTRSLELATARREELLDLIAVLSRKPKVRRASGRTCADAARVLNESEQPNQQPDMIGTLGVDGGAPGGGNLGTSPNRKAPSVFGSPSGAIVEVA